MVRACCGGGGRYIVEAATAREAWEKVKKLAKRNGNIRRYWDCPGGVEIWCEGYRFSPRPFYWGREGERGN